MVRRLPGVDLGAKEYGVKSFYVHDGKSLHTLRDMPQWEVLGGQCSRIDRNV